MDPSTLTLRDIHGLDGIPWLPLAPGWWFVFGLIALVPLLVALRFWLLYHGPWLGWRSDARRQLRELSRALATEDPRDVASRLSELLRRIAMARSSRRVAAGLTGEAWLLWLAEQDASGFDWKQRGQILLIAPYMPPGMVVERNEVSALIRAANRWIDATQPSQKEAVSLERIKATLKSVYRERGSARV